MAIISDNNDGTYNVNKNNRELIGQIKYSRGLYRLYISRRKEITSITSKDLHQIDQFIDDLETPKEQFHG